MAYNALKNAAQDCLRAQNELAVSAHEVREAGLSLRELWISWLDLLAERAVIEARVEYERHDAILMEPDDAVDKIVQALRDNGYDPTIDLDAMETSPATRPVDATPGPE